MNDEPLLLFRAVNVTVYILAAALYLVRTSDLWAGENRGQRVKRLGIGSTLAAVAAGSINAYRLDVPPSWATPMFTATGVLTLLGLWLTRRRS